MPVRIVVLAVDCDDAVHQMQQRWRLWQPSGKDRLLWLVEGLDLQPRVLLDPSRELEPLYPVRVERAQLLWVHPEPLRRLLKRRVLLESGGVDVDRNGLLSND